MSIEIVDQDAVVNLVKRNWDQECSISLMTRRGFVITERQYTKRTRGKSKKDKVKSMNGIHSPRYGTDWEDEHAFEERYRCDCGHLKGKQFENMKCTVCDTTVHYKEADIEYMGWIILENHKIIQPLFYKQLDNVISTKQIPFTDIISSDLTIDLDGHIVKKPRTKETNEFVGMGIMAFYERFDEVLDYYLKKKPNYAELIESLRKDKDSVFASCIPVYSSLLRPDSKSANSYFTYKANKIYNPIQSKVRLLNQRTKRTEFSDFVTEEDVLKTHNTLYTLQEKVNELWADTYNMINGKFGHIRGEITGGRMNFSARNVIIPDKTLQADEVRMGYTTFLELFRYEIIAILKHMSGGKSYSHACFEWERATRVFDARVYEIIKYIIQEFKVGVVINRNPTINFKSIIYMRIIEVRPYLNENQTLSLPIMVLSGLNADFDGDQLNIFAMKGDKINKEVNKIYNPRESHMISRNNGLIDPLTSLIKDQAIGLYAFNNID